MYVGCISVGFVNLFCKEKNLQDKLAVIHARVNLKTEQFAKCVLQVGQSAQYGIWSKEVMRNHVRFIRPNLPK